MLVLFEPEGACVVLDVDLYDFPDDLSDFFLVEDVPDALHSNITIYNNSTLSPLNSTNNSDALTISAIYIA